MSLEKNARVTWTLDGRNMGVVLTKDGGGVDSEEKKLRPGGGEAEESLGGTSTRENITLEVLQRNTSLVNVRFAESRAGKGVVLVVEQPLDIDGFADGPPHQTRGTLKAIKPSKRDANGSDEAKYTVEITALVDA
jgi:hypothetical protein